jgi:hypothetical protein
MIWLNGDDFSGLGIWTLELTEISTPSEPGPNAKHLLAHTMPSIAAANLSFNVDSKQTFPVRSDVAVKFKLRR